MSLRSVMFTLSVAFFSCSATVLLEVVKLTVVLLGVVILIVVVPYPQHLLSNSTCYEKKLAAIKNSITRERI